MTEGSQEEGKRLLYSAAAFFTSAFSLFIRPKFLTFQDSPLRQFGKTPKSTKVS